MKQTYLFVSPFKGRSYKIPYMIWVGSYLLEMHQSITVQSIGCCALLLGFNYCLGLQPGRFPQASPLNFLGPVSLPVELDNRST